MGRKPVLVVIRLDGDGDGGREARLAKRRGSVT